MKKGFFVTLEGVEGSGKSTQSKLLAERIKKDLGINQVEIYREPGSDPVAEKIREILQDENNFITDLAELFLFEAARSQFAQKILSPALHKLDIIICDRYFDSTIAYQGYGRGIELGLIEQLNLCASSETIPNCTFWLDLLPKFGFKRLGKNLDRIERAGKDFHERVWNGFLKIAEQEINRFIQIECQSPDFDRELTRDEIHEQIWPIFLKKYKWFKQIKE